MFKKKSAAAAPEGKEFEETLVAGEPAQEPALAPEDEGATLADEPIPGPSMETETPAPWAPGPVDREFPAEVEPFIRRSDLDLILVEDSFDRPTKLNLEGKVTPSPRTALAEKTWHPKHKTALADIHKAIDKLKVTPVKPMKWLRSFKPRVEDTKAVFERIPPNIINKRIVFETEGGFVVEVTYRDGPETRKKFFTADTREDRTKALEQIQSGRYAKTTIVGAEAMSKLTTPRRPAHLKVPPGKVNTWPITNKIDVIDIEGIGDIYGRRLHELGIHTTDQLRLTNATVLANNLSTLTGTVERWQHMAELMTIEGVGKQTAETLVNAGVTNIDILRKMRPKELARRIRQSKGGKGGMQPKRAKGIIQGGRKLKKAQQPFPVVEA